MLRKIDEKTDYIDRLKIGLSNMVRNYGFENMNEFYLSYKESKTAFADYQQKVLGNIINRTKPNGRDKFFCFPNYMDYYVLLFMFTNLLV